MIPDALELAHQRSQRGEPFVLATVVWRRAPSSGRQGSKALIGPDGRVTGWLGGACAEPAVVREALEALADGQPRLMALGPRDEIESEEREAVVTVPIACQSEGALEIYLEPMLPKPHLVAVGRSPAVDALAAMAAALGWRTAVIDDGGSAGDHPGVERVITSLDFEAAAVTERSFVVVATQGHYDEAALEAALAVDPAYLGLVASRARAEHVLAYLRQRGASEESLSRVRAPAGLDLGAVAHEEIAVAILGEIVRLKASGAIGRGAVVAEAGEQAVDPVCEMVVDVATSRYRSSFGERSYHFCSAGCQASFEAEPERYVGASSAAG